MCTNKMTGARRLALGLGGLLFLLSGCAASSVPEAGGQESDERASALGVSGGTGGSGATCTPAIAPLQSSYGAGAPIGVTVSGLPGNDLDWIGLFDPAADANTRIAWQYTRGVQSGGFTFPGVPKGQYEVRAYANNSTELLAALSVKVDQSAARIKPAAPKFDLFQPVTVSVTGLPGNQLDWVGVFEHGADVNTRVAWQYTGGIESGDFSFGALPEGKYEIRAYADNSELLLGTSAAIHVSKSSVSIEPAQASYPAFEPIGVDVSGLPGNALDWVGLFAPGADVDTRVDYQYTGGITSGVLSFPGVPQGTYELRVYANNSTLLLGTSKAFSVTASAASVQPAKPTYVSGETVVANFSGMPGNELDWIGLFVPGADVNTRVAWQYTNGLVSGSAGFPGVPAGTYEIRVYANNSTALLSTSPQFTVTGD